MEFKEWLNTVGVCKERGGDEEKTGLFTKDMVWFSKFDDSYITLDALVKSGDIDGYLKVLAKHEVTEQLTHGVGFSPKENKWYGWSHRAIYGFGIGSEVNKGDCAYVAPNDADAIEDAVRFWTDDDRPAVCDGEISVDADGMRHVQVTWPGPKDSEISGVPHYLPKEPGRGEWTARTLDDAKQMAVDFNEGVS